MARDAGLEALLGDDLADERGLSGKAMFGGWAWLLDGNLLCGARDDGMLARIGEANEAWAHALHGVRPMVMQGRTMRGWVKAEMETCGDDAVRRRLIEAALAFTRALPSK